jgi:hypothetical protein
MTGKSTDIELLKELIQNPKLGEILLHYKKISLEQLGQGLERQKQENLPIGQILIGMNIITENELIELLSIQSKIDKIVSESYKELEELTIESPEI